MPQREVISISLPATRARQLRKVVSKSGATMSAFLRDAIEQKLQMEQWKEVRKIGNQIAKKYKVSPEDLEDIVDEFRE